MTNGADTITICPNCATPCNVRKQADPRRQPWEPEYQDVSVRCRTCAWEFITDADGTIADDGEVEGMAELGIDDEGELRAADPLEEPFPAWHGEVSAVSGRKLHGWDREMPSVWNDDEEMDNTDPESVVELTVVCPNCQRIVYGFSPDTIACSDCNWHYSVERERDDWDEYEEFEDDSSEEYTPESFNAQFLQPICVSPCGTKDYTSIGDAIRQTESGRRIEVYPGWYDEALEINRPVTLVGVGPREDIILVSRRGPCIGMHSNWASMRGLTLRYLGTEPKTAALNLVRGTVRNCAITSASDQCVYMHDGTLSDCLIHDGNGTGIEGLGSGIVENCTLRHHAGAAVRMRQSCLLLRGCRLESGHAEGVIVERAASASIVDCQIIGQGADGVVVAGERVLLARCQIVGGQGAGVRVSGSMAIERCTITENRGTGVRVLGGAVYGWRSQIVNGHGRGVSVAGTGVVRLRRCVVAHHHGAGLAGHGPTRLDVRRCRVCNNHVSTSG